MGGDLRALLGADAHQALLGEVLGHTDEIRTGQQRDPDQYRERRLQDRAEVGGGALQDEDAGRRPP